MVQSFCELDKMNAMNIKNYRLLRVTPCRLEDSYHCLGGTCYLIIREEK
jgi:hypothetical protein